MTGVIVIATDWSYSQGGVNSFNYDLVLTLGRLRKELNIRIMCVCYKEPTMLKAEDAKSNGIEIFTLGKKNFEFDFQEDIPNLLKILKKFRGCDHIYIIGHDVFTGDLAIHLKTYAKQSTAVIFHHMDYESYSAIKGEVNPSKLATKFSKQTRYLKEADIVVAVGPKLYNSAIGKTEKPVLKFIPGLPIIEEWKQSTDRINAITFGRYDERTDRLKQMSLAVQAFSTYLSTLDASDTSDHTLKVIGINTEDEAIALIEKNTPTSRRFVNILPLPYTENRNELFEMLRKANMALMLSYHEGFGLAGYEAIAAGVPLILSKNSGLYLFLSDLVGSDKLTKFGIYPVGIKASGDGTVNPEDLELVTEAIKILYKNNRDYLDRISGLKKMLKAEYSWNKAGIFLIDQLRKTTGRIIPVKSGNLNKTSNSKKASQSKISIGRRDLWNILNSKLIIPVEPNLNFVHREELEAQFRQNIIQNDFLVVLGDHGMGKSSLARNFIKDNYEDFDHILWINFQNSLKQSMVSSILSTIAGNAIIAINGIEEFYNQVMHLLNQIDGRKLLVIDNLDLSEELENTIHQLKLQQWKVVVTTTRDPSIIPESKKIRVNVMSYEEGYNLLGNIVGEKSTFTIENFKEVFPENQLSPFLIEYFSYYWKKELIAERRFGEINQEKRIQTLYRYFRPEANLFEFYDIVFRREAAQFTFQQLQFLGIYSLFPNNFSDVSIIREVLSLWYSVAEQSENIHHFIEAGWINRNLIIHFLRQSIILQHVTIEQQAIQVLTSFLAEKFKINEGESPLGKIQYLPLGYSLHEKQLEARDTNLMLHRMAILEFDLAKLDEASELQDAVIKKSKDEVLIGAALFEKGLIEERKANYYDSIGLLKQSLNYIKADTLERVNVLSKISVVYGKIYFREKTASIENKILSFLNQAITMLTHLVESGQLTETSADVGTVYVDSGSVLSELDDHQDIANKYFIKGISIYEVSLKPMHPWLATTYNLYGNYLTRHDLPLAKEFIERSITMRTEIFKDQPNHFNLAEGYHDYAYVLLLLGDYEPALVNVERAIAIRSKDVESRGEGFKKRLQYSLDLKERIITAAREKGMM